MVAFSPSSVPFSGRHRAESATLQLNLWPWGPFPLLQQGVLPQGLPLVAGKALHCASTSGRAYGLPAVPLLNPVSYKTPGILPVAGGLCWHQLQPAAKPHPSEAAEPPLKQHQNSLFPSQHRREGFSSF